MTSENLPNLTVELRFYDNELFSAVGNYPSGFSGLFVLKVQDRVGGFGKRFNFTASNSGKLRYEYLGIEE